MYIFLFNTVPLINLTPSDDDMIPWKLTPQTICDDGLMEYNENEMLQGTGHPAEIQEFYSRFSAGCPSLFFVAKSVRLFMNQNETFWNEVESMLNEFQSELNKFTPTLPPSFQHKWNILKWSWIDVEWVSKCVKTVYPHPPPSFQPKWNILKWSWIDVEWVAKWVKSVYPNLPPSFQPKWNILKWSWIDVEWVSKCVKTVCPLQLSTSFNIV